MARVVNYIGELRIPKNLLGVLLPLFWCSVSDEILVSAGVGELGCYGKFCK